MSNPRYSEEFKSEAVRQVIDRGYSVKEVAERIGVCAGSLYKWVGTAKAGNPAADELSKTKLENQRLKAELRRVQEERDILKKAAVGSMGQRNTYPKEEQTGGKNGPDGKTWSLGVRKTRTVAKMASRGIAQ